MAKRKTIKVETLQSWIKEEINSTNARLTEALSDRNTLLIIDLENYLKALSGIDCYINKQIL